MDIIFNCPECEQELSVDSSGAGTEINCPTCGEKIVVPPAPPGTVAAAALAVVRDAAHPVNPIASSAAAKVEMHLKVPVHDKPTESLIEKPLPPLEVAAKEMDKKIRIKTIRRIDCVEVGHDHFDDAVTNFLGKIGESNIVSINTLAYTHLDIGTQKLLTDYGVLIVFKG
jgi:DNA-directed RNA polymerase subunit RPC12/RpoP